MSLHGTTGALVEKTGERLLIQHLAAAGHGLVIKTKRTAGLTALGSARTLKAERAVLPGAPGVDLGAGCARYSGSDALCRKPSAPLEKVQGLQRFSPESVPDCKCRAQPSALCIQDRLHCRDCGRHSGVRVLFLAPLQSLWLQVLLASSGFPVLGSGCEAR